MKMLRLVHGKEVKIQNKTDIDKVVNIFRDRLPFYFVKKEKASEETLENWELLTKIFPKGFIADTPMELFQLKEKDNPFSNRV